MPDRPMTRLDAYLILAALLAGAGWAALAWPMLLWTYQYDLAFVFRPRGFGKVFGDPEMRNGAIRIGLKILCVAITPATFLVPILGARRRSSFAAPGLTACVAASVGVIAEVAYYPLWLWTMFGELTRLQRNLWSNIVQWPRMREQATVLGAIACGIGEHPGLVVLGVFLASWVAGRESPGSSGLERWGRALGVLWVVAAIGLLLVPIVS